MSVKRITIRISPELHQRLVRAAAASQVSLNQLAVEALETYAARQVQFPLRELSALLAPLAEAMELSEAELLGHAREARRRIWQERYQQATQAATDYRSR